MDKWEWFYDVAYFHMYAVRHTEDKSFHSSLLFHLTNEDEAKRLCDYLNSREEKE